MKCQLCNQAEATVQLTCLAGDKMSGKVDLCEDCAKAHDLSDPTRITLTEKSSVWGWGFSLADLLEKISRKNRQNPE